MIAYFFLEENGACLNLNQEITFSEEWNFFLLVTCLIDFARRDSPNKQSDLAHKDTKFE